MRRIILDRGRHCLVAIADAEPAAEVEALDRDALAAQLRDQLAAPGAKAASKGAKVGELRADMDGEPDRLERRAARACGRRRRGRMRQIDAELVLLPAGRDLGVGPRIDVGIDAERDRRASCPSAAATALSSSSSGTDSTLIWRTPWPSAKRSSAAVLPMPEKTMRSPGMPAASARRNSPSETTSAPAPSRANVAITARFEFAFTE